MRASGDCAVVARMIACGKFIGVECDVRSVTRLYRQNVTTGSVKDCKNEWIFNRLLKWFSSSVQERTVTEIKVQAENKVIPSPFIVLAILLPFLQPDSDLLIFPRLTARIS